MNTAKPCSQKLDFSKLANNSNIQKTSDLFKTQTNSNSLFNNQNLTNAQSNNFKSSLFQEQSVMQVQNPTSQFNCQYSSQSDFGTKQNCTSQADILLKQNFQQTQKTTQEKGQNDASFRNTKDVSFQTNDNLISQFEFQLNKNQQQSTSKSINLLQSTDSYFSCAIHSQYNLVYVCLDQQCKDFGLICSECMRLCHIQCVKNNQITRVQDYLKSISENNYQDNEKLLLTTKSKMINLRFQTAKELNQIINLIDFFANKKEQGRNFYYELCDIGNNREIYQKIIKDSILEKDIFINEDQINFVENIKMISDQIESDCQEIIRKTQEITKFHKRNFEEIKKSSKVLVNNINQLQSLNDFILDLRISMYQKQYLKIIRNPTKINESNISLLCNSLQNFIYLQVFMFDFQRSNFNIQLLQQLIEQLCQMNELNYIIFGFTNTIANDKIFQEIAKLFKHIKLKKLGLNLEFTQVTFQGFLEFANDHKNYLANLDRLIIRNSPFVKLLENKENANQWKTPINFQIY